jgi:hypothetical protein
LAGEATLESLEPELTVTVQRLVQVEITPEHLTQFHRLTLDLDRSFLTGHHQLMRSGSRAFSPV